MSFVNIIFAIIVILVLIVLLSQTVLSFYINSISDVFGYTFVITTQVIGWVIVWRLFTTEPPNSGDEKKLNTN
jgi:amino acid transporter